MDQQPHDSLPALDLPKPIGEQLPIGSEQLPDRAPTEVSGAKASEHPQQGSGNPLTAQPMLPVTSQPIALPQNLAPQSVGSVPGMPAIADDADLIEKEWVAKAKEIVEKTKHDPFQQNTEMNKVKADYMKKRYNKDIKLGQE